MDIAYPKKWSFDHHECPTHLLLKDEAISAEWGEDVLNDPNPVVIGRIEKVDDENITIIDRLPERYHDDRNLFRPYGKEVRTSLYLRPCDRPPA